jgi:hypothetical protein
MLEYHYLSFAGKLKLLEDCTATPDPDCGCMKPWFSSTFWQLLLWKWIKPLNFCDKDQVGLLWIQATFWFFCV